VDGRRRDRSIAPENWAWPETERQRSAPTIGGFTPRHAAVARPRGGRRDRKLATRNSSSTKTGSS